MKPYCLLLVALVVSWNAYSQKARQVLHLTITVSNLDSILPFYTTLLPFSLAGIREVAPGTLKRVFGITTSSKARVATLQLGAETLELLDFGAPDPGRPIPSDSRSNDGWFQHVAIVVSDMDKAYQRLRTGKVEHISTAPQTLPGYITAAAGVKAFYFRDPDGHVLELISFPPGKGKPGWQQPDGKLFLGIDHTAIGSADTDASLAFYRDVLGLQIGGTSENYGPEQEHLNQVFGAHLLISGLTTGQGVGIELLDYIAPPGGRPYPTATRATDRWHWYTAVLVTGLDDLYTQLQRKKYTLISAGIVSLDGLGLAASRGMLIRDPDGHALLLCE